MNTITVDERFGGCPECGGNDGYVNAEAPHWGVCQAHKLRWYVGFDLFSPRKDESEAELPADPDERARKLQETELQIKARELRDRDQRDRRLAELMPKVEKALTAALEPLAAEMDEADEVRVTIGGHSQLVLTKRGVKVPVEGIDF